MTTVPFTDPTISAPKGAPPKSTPKAILIAKINNAQLCDPTSKCLVYLKEMVNRHCGDNETINLAYWERQLDFIVRENPTFSTWAAQLPAFARIAFREIEAAVPYTPVQEYHTTTGNARMLVGARRIRTGRPHGNELVDFRRQLNRDYTV